MIILVSLVAVLALVCLVYGFFLLVKMKPELVISKVTNVILTLPSTNMNQAFEFICIPVVCYAVLLCLYLAIQATKI